MGVSGPIGKRDDERIRRNKTGEDGLETKDFSMDDDVVIPKAKFDNPEVQGMWVALQKSVNVQFYEPTDWAYALHVFKRWDKALADEKEPGAMLMSALDGMLTKLVLTEADRRRLKIEAHRGAAAEGSTGVKAEAFYEAQFEKQRERFAQGA